MPRHACLFAAPLLLACTLLLAQQPPTEPLPAVPMPPDREAESYLLYAKLMPLGETAGKDWPHDQYLLQDTTVALIPPDKPCNPPPAAGASANLDSSMNPHNAIHPPTEHAQDLAEILDDFDQHCHDRITLSPDADAWKLTVPVHLLNPAEQAEFRTVHGRVDSPAAEKYKGAPALYAFSEVYFNAHHTVAIVYATHWCGGLCGQGFWAAFMLDNDNVWQRQSNWTSSGWIS